MSTWAGGVRERIRVLVYSDNVAARRQVITALGPRPHPDLPQVEYVEAATPAAAMALLQAGSLALAILDGEATPAGGMGIAKQAGDELDSCPPILLLIGRADDAWLARWSRADAVVPHPIDPLRLAAAVTELLLTEVNAAVSTRKAR
ncbi:MULTISPECIES: hypothetical protein [Mycolicibacterium]|nr:MULTISPECIES: hypothetical protein [Mycolicibacterium]MCA4724929.1 hypothetical protein [Mycolicibacterium fortuitum]NOP95455.1 hypothetical protein [Mycolicibacterium fortuitum]OBK06598.1 hypothetical protein A5637_06640 [Mycolicibacterium fortuitum]UBV17270.1 hypothetical protein H8Z57_11075 [Mycolicibacterium fortuitum]